jgi:uncharacterized RDD family membrane protein YckC
MPTDPAAIEYIRVPLWRRGTALLIDFLAVSLLSLLLGGSAIAIIIVFLIGWVGLRVVWVARNRGQSLGRWALDMRIIDLQRGGTPDLLTLTKRESVIGLGAALLLIGLVNLSPGAPWALLLFVPIALDLSVAWINRDEQQAFHDQWTQTQIVQSRRGYSLDLKLKRLLVAAQRRVK